MIGRTFDGFWSTGPEVAFCHDNCTIIVTKKGLSMLWIFKIRRFLTERSIYGASELRSVVINQDLDRVVF